VAPVEFRGALALSIVHYQLVGAEVGEIFRGLVILSRIQKAQLAPQTEDATDGSSRQFYGLDNRRFVVLMPKADLAPSQRVVLNHDLADDEILLRELVLVTSFVGLLLVLLANRSGGAVRRTIVLFCIFLRKRGPDCREQQH